MDLDNIQVQQKRVTFFSRETQIFIAVLSLNTTITLSIDVNQTTPRLISLLKKAEQFQDKT